MSDARYDIVIIGAGIVGLATAMELVQRSPDLKLVVLDKEDRLAAHQSGHNSGVIHAGLYYKPGSLKARMAVEGARSMVEFCQQHDLPYEMCGKVVVATREEELPRLEELARRGMANGVPGLERISGDQIREYEPHAAGIAGLWSPSTGIVDYALVCQAYARIVQEGGGEVCLNARVTGIQQRADELILETPAGERPDRGHDGQHPGPAHRPLSRRVLRAGRREPQVSAWTDLPGARSPFSVPGGAFH